MYAPVPLERRDLALKIQNYTTKCKYTMSKISRFRGIFCDSKADVNTQAERAHGTITIYRGFFLFCP